MNFFEKTIESKIIYQGEIFNITTNKIKLKNNHIASREVVKKSSAACVIAITRNKNIVLVKQFRYAIGKHLIEIPAGKMESFEKHPLLCAKRELLEETGFKAPNWINLGPILPCPGFCNEKLFLFLAKNSFKAQSPKPDPDEFLQTITMPLDLAVQRATFGSFSDAKTICAILKLHNLAQLHKIII